jgi:hypothetical protein
MPFNFDKSSLEAKLPSAGRQSATVIDVNVHPGEDATWLNVLFQLDSGHQLEHLVAIDAETTSRFLNRLDEGFAFMESMCEATGADIGTLREPRDIIGAFLDKSVDVIVALRAKGEMKRPFVKAVLKH